MLARLAFAVAALALGTPASAQPVDDLQQDDAQVQTIGWRLSHANAGFCARAAPGIGLLLGDAQTFADPELARAAYGLSGDIAVAAVAAGSPAEAAGLAVNAVVTAVACQSDPHRARAAGTASGRCKHGLNRLRRALARSR